MAQALYFKKQLLFPMVVNMVQWLFGKQIPLCSTKRNVPYPNIYHKRLQIQLVFKDPFVSGATVQLLVLRWKRFQGSTGTWSPQQFSILIIEEVQGLERCTIREPRIHSYNGEIFCGYATMPGECTLSSSGKAPARISQVTRSTSWTVSRENSLKYLIMFIFFFDEGQRLPFALSG